MLARSFLPCKNVNICVHSRAHARGPAGRVCQLELIKHHSPCFTCTRVPDPRACDNKECRPWRQWFIDRWAEIHALAPQDQSKDHTSRMTAVDPCDGCICARIACIGLCQKKQQWLEENGDIDGELEGCRD